MTGTTACKWDSVIPFNKHIMTTIGRSKKLVPMYENEWVMRECETTNKSIHHCRDEFNEISKEGMWQKLNKLIKPNGAIVLFGSEPFSSSLRMSNIKNYKYDWIWEKSNPTGMGQANKRPMKYHEIISVFYFEQPIYNKQMIKRECNRIKQAHASNYNFNVSSSKSGNQQSVSYKNIDSKRYDANLKNPSSIIKINSLRANSKEWNSHQTQKPVALMEYLIKTYTNKNELVLDFTSGSCSTGIACLNTNRSFIGIEKDENYFDIGVKRIKENMNDGFELVVNQQGD